MKMLTCKMDPKKEIYDINIDDMSNSDLIECIMTLMNLCYHGLKKHDEIMAEGFKTVLQKNVMAGYRWHEEIILKDDEETKDLKH